MSGRIVRKDANRAFEDQSYAPSVVSCENSLFWACKVRPCGKNKIWTFWQFKIFKKKHNNKPNLEYCSEKIVQQMHSHSMPVKINFFLSIASEIAI
jgi:hypothetical protein